MATPERSRTSSVVPYVLDADEGEIVRAAGGAVTVKASGPFFDVATTTLRAGEEPSPHVHEEEDEALYVLEGTLSVDAGGEVMWAAAGAFVYVPRGVRHALRAESGLVRLLVVFAPWGLLGACRQGDDAAPGAGA